MPPQHLRRRSGPHRPHCPDCLTPFAPEDVDVERGFAWCGPCAKAMHLQPPDSAPPPPAGPARLQKKESGGHLHLSWHTARTMDWLNGPLMSAMGAAMLILPSYGLARDSWGLLPLLSVFWVLGGLILANGLRALWRWGERVQLRVEGRCLHIQGGPFSWGSPRVVDAALIRRLRIIREREAFLDRVRQPFQEDTLYTVMAELRAGGEQVVARGFLSRAETLWFALEIHQALDLSEPLELLA